MFHIYQEEEYVTFETRPSSTKYFLHSLKPVQIKAAITPQPKASQPASCRLKSELL